MEERRIISNSQGVHPKPRHSQSLTRGWKCWGEQMQWVHWTFDTLLPATHTSKPDCLGETTAKGHHNILKEGINISLSNWKGLREGSTEVCVLSNIIQCFHWWLYEEIMNNLTTFSNDSKWLSGKRSCSLRDSPRTSNYLENCCTALKNRMHFNMGKLCVLYNNQNQK